MTLSILRSMSMAFALLGAAALAACGGGGGGGSSIPTSGGGSVTHAAFRAGFAGVGRGGAASVRRPEDAGLTSALIPIADFIVPDSYVTVVPYAIAGATAVAYYDPTTGTVPSPTPTITWSHTGVATTLGAPAVPVTIANVTIAGESFATAPTSPGTGTISGVASTGDAVALTFNAYAGGGIATGTNGNGFQSCLTFASGTSTPGTTGDICLVTNSDGTSSVSAPLGAVLVQKPIDAVTAADVALVPTASTLIPTVTIIPGFGTYTVVARTAAGNLVKWEPAANQGANTVTGNINLEYGPYRIASSSTFDY